MIGQTDRQDIHTHHGPVPQGEPFTNGHPKNRNTYKNDIIWTIKVYTLHIMNAAIYKNSSRDEIANVTFYAVRPGSYRNSLK